MLLLLILLFGAVFAFIAISPEELTQTILAGAWILMALMAVGSTISALIR